MGQLSRMGPKIAIPFSTPLPARLAPGGHAEELKKWFRRQANSLIRPSDPVPAPILCAIIDRDFFAPRLKAAADDVVEI